MNALAPIAPNEPSVAVVVASLGRPELLRQMEGLMEAQTSRPDMLLFSLVSEADWPAGLEQTERLRMILERKGLCAQRNNALEWLDSRYDIIVFYDDDFVPSRYSIQRIREFFSMHPDVVGATGNVLESPPRKLLSNTSML